MTLNEIKTRYKGIQSKLKFINDCGCLFLCICTIIEEVNGKPVDLIDVIQKSKANKWLAEDYTVNDSLMILNKFTGKNFKRKIVKELPSVIKNNEFTVEKWLNPKTGGNHFKRRFVDTLTSSQTVKTGTLQEYYIYYY